MRRVQRALLVGVCLALVVPSTGGAALPATSLYDHVVDTIESNMGYVPERVIANGVEMNTRDALAILKANPQFTTSGIAASAQPSDIGRGTRSGGFDCLIATISYAEVFGFGPLPSPVPDAMVGETVSGLPGGAICGGIPFVRLGSASAAIDPGASFQFACVGGLGAYWLVSPVDCYVGSGGSPYASSAVYGNVGYVEYVLDFFGFFWIHEELLFGGVQNGLPGAWEDASLITIE